MKLIYTILLLFSFSDVFAAAGETKEDGARKTSRIKVQPEGVPYYFEAMHLDPEGKSLAREYFRAEYKLFDNFLREVLPKLSKESMGKKKIVVKATKSVLKDFVEICENRGVADNKWVVSVVRKEDDVPLMRMCAITNSKSLFSYHLGIHHTFAQFSDDNEERPKGLSLKLHGFAARFLADRNAKLRYMVSAPTRIMHQILERAYVGVLPRIRIKRERGEQYMSVDGKDHHLTGPELWLKSIRLKEINMPIEVLKEF